MLEPASYSALIVSQSYRCFLIVTPQSNAKGRFRPHLPQPPRLQRGHAPGPAVLGGFERGNTGFEHGHSLAVISQV